MLARRRGWQDACARLEGQFAQHPLTGGRDGNILRLVASIAGIRDVRIGVTTCHPDVRLVLDYWQQKCAGRLMPSRADIDPSELRRFLPHITLVDVVADERRFVYRLVGTSEVELRGYDPTGRPVAEAYFATTAR